jgi:hypothetical protein
MNTLDQAGDETVATDHSIADRRICQGVAWLSLAAVIGLHLLLVSGLVLDPRHPVGLVALLLRNQLF